MCICRYIRCKRPAATTRRRVALCANASFIRSNCPPSIGSPELEYTARPEYYPRRTDPAADVSHRGCWIGQEKKHSNHGKGTIEGNPKHARRGADDRKASLHHPSLDSRRLIPTEESTAGSALRMVARRDRPVVTRAACNFAHESTRAFVGSRSGGGKSHWRGQVRE
jgi:hypothetical protein